MCPACGAPVPEGARFCPSCGRALVVRHDERRVATVLFADLVGFTTFSEAADPEHVKGTVDRCFERLVADVAAFGGQVDKIVGDAIVALFGAPVAHEDDAERAVRAALRMQQTLAAMRAADGFDVEMRIGVNTGEVLVGALRAGGDYTAMGDVVNTASRLQTAAAPGEVLVGPDTYAATAGAVRYEPRGPVVIRGREAPLDVWRALEQSQPPGQRRARPPTPLIGRDVELDLLTSGIRKAVARRRAQLVVLSGEPGVGKTRLALELRDVVTEHHHACVLLGHCVPYGEANVWFPFAEALRELFGLDGGEPADVATAQVRRCVTETTGLDDADPEVVRLVEGLRTLLGHVDDAVEPARARDEAVRSLLACLDEMCERQPVVLALADLHWADDAVLEVLEQLLRRLRGRPFVLFATTRPELTERWTPRPTGYDALLLELEPLDTDASTALGRTLLGPDATDDVVRLLVERSGGNPFFMEELAAVLAASNGGPRTGPRPGIAVPATLRGLVASRLDALDLGDRAVLDDCAVVGASGRVDVVDALAREHGIADARARLARLGEDNFVTVDGDMFVFRSQLVRDVAYDMLTKGERARRHLAVAHHLAKWAGDTDRLEQVLDGLARHYGIAANLTAELGDVEGVPANLESSAVEFLERAATKAERQERWRVAADLLAMALKLTPVGSERRCRLLLARARARAELRQLAAAREDALAVSREAQERADAETRAAALVVLGDVEHKEGDLVAAERTLDEAVSCWRGLAPRGEQAGLADALRAQGMNRMFLGRNEAAAESIEEALAAYRTAGDERGEAWALQNLAWIAFNTGDMEVAEQRLHESADTFAAIGDWGGLAWAFGLLAWVRWGEGRLDEAEALAVQAFGRGGESGDPWASSMMLVLLAHVAVWRGNVTLALERATSARDRFVEIGNVWGEMQATMPLSLAQLAAGRITEARALAAHSSELAQGLSDSMREAPVGLEAAISVRIGDAAAALECVEPDSPGPGHDDARLAHGLALLQDGQVDAALRTLHVALDTAIHSGVSSALTAAVAIAETAAGRPADALARCDRATEPVTFLDGIHLAFARAFASARLGDEERARAQCDRAVAIADGTESRLEQAVTRLARAHVLAVVAPDEAASAAAEADAYLGTLGIAARGWRRLFALAAGA